MKTSEDNFGYGKVEEEKKKKKKHEGDFVGIMEACERYFSKSCIGLEVTYK